jgi:hypothetical protein
MALLVSLLLVLVSASVLAWPILKGRRVSSSSISPQDSLEEVLERRQRIYDEIQTLALDYELGNIPAREYEEEIGVHRLQAADALREEERLQETLARLEDELEDQALELRRSWGTVKEVTPCGICGGGMDVEAVMCPRCALSQDEDGSESEEEEARG